MFFRLIFIAILSAPYLLNAQTLSDPVYVNYTLLPGSDNESIYFTEINAALPPVRFSEKAVLYHTLYHRYTNFGDGVASVNSYFLQSLHDIRITPILRAQVSQRSELVFISRLMVRSDLQQRLSSRDLFAQVVLLGNYSISDRLKIGLGAALNNDFERNRLIPIGSLNYTGRKFKVEIVYPNAHFLRTAGQHVEYGLFMNVDGAISHSPGWLDNGHYIRTFQLLVAPALSYRVYKKLFLHVKSGVALGRTVEFLDHDFNATSKVNLSDAWFIRAGFGLRLNNP